MKQQNKSPLGNLGCCLGAILLSPILLVVIILHILYTPIDFIRYKCSLYCKETGQKYVWLVTTSKMFKIYTLIKKHGIDITYRVMPNTNAVYGYLIATDTLIILDDYVFPGESGEWYTNVENEELRLDRSQMAHLDKYEEDYKERLAAVVHLVAVEDLPEGAMREAAMKEPALLVYDNKKRGDLKEKLERLALERAKGL